MKRFINRKMVAVICVLILVMFAAAACNNGDDSGNQQQLELERNNDSLESSENQEDSVARDIPDNLPEKDLGGRDINILCSETVITEFDAEQYTGELINDAVLERNLAVSERFNVNINPVRVAGGWNDQTAYVSAVKNSVLAGTEVYQIATGLMSFFPNIIGEGMLLNLNSLDYLDFDKPWWGREIVSELSVGTNLYLAPGSIALSLYDCMTAFFFNKQIVQDYELPDLFKLVKNKEWTFDRMAQISRTVSGDLDGNGIFNDSDLYGFALGSGAITNAFPSAFNLRVTSKDENNIPHLDFETERWSSAVEKLLNLIQEQSTHLVPDDVDANRLRNMFREDRILFYPTTLAMARDLRVMETDFGILPFPMYDSAQGSYYTGIFTHATMVGIPSNVSEPDDIALIVEALASESHRTVIPVYYDISLKIKDARDEESAEMIDILRDNIWLNFGAAYTVSAGGVGRYMRDMVERGDANFMSHFESTIDTRNAALELFVNGILDLQE